MENLKTVLNNYGFSFKKSLGQNFLTDYNLLDEIVLGAGVDDKTTVLEIGCGAGALTKALAKRAKKVFGYEIDCRLKNVLDDALFGLKNVEIEYKDIMREKMADLEKKIGVEYIMVANLPYYITTPIVADFLEKAKHIKGMAVMVQKEVAERFTAKEGSADYGAITVAINLRGSAKIIKEVPKQMFTPMPSVDSAVVKIDIDRNKFINADLKKVRDTVRCGFNNRRKMLVNNIMQSYSFDRNTADTALVNAGVDTLTRGETLSAEKYVALTEKIEELRK